MLFSEPKIPQYCQALCRVDDGLRFSALQRAENSSMGFARGSSSAAWCVSVLFSEPKIPQSTRLRAIIAASGGGFQCSSASRKFLNFLQARCGRRVVWFQCSSASRKFLNQNRGCGHRAVRVRFQCSSASRKFLNFTCRRAVVYIFNRFSALQRAENSSISIRCAAHALNCARFSALQRAENSSIMFREVALVDHRRFSALQRAENSSIELLVGTHVPEPDVSVLFSEPKIPQSYGGDVHDLNPAAVSVLFSEPKIPQFG